MWPFIKPIRLIRYLFVWRVNSSLVRLPWFLPTELSLVLGTTIANRLPTRRAQPWRKALAPWDELGGLSLVGKKKNKTVPEIAWPIEAVLFAYPGKLTYGQGEPILWELKLMGESADHGFFLEVILPAVEEAGSLSNPEWQNRNIIWNHFDIQAIYAARGKQWEPIVSDGHLDLNYRPTPTQWAEGMTFRPEARQRPFDRLTWLTPYDLGDAADATLPPRSRKRRRRKNGQPHAPDLKELLEALLVRMSQLLPGKYNSPDDVWEALDPEEKSTFQDALEQAARIPIRHARLKSAPKYWAGRWIGRQIFPSIPRPLIPYLELASILHVGKQTHFGCGTFEIR